MSDTTRPTDRSPRPALTSCTVTCLALAVAPVVAIPFLPDDLSEITATYAPFASTVFIGLAVLFFWLTHRPRRTENRPGVMQGLLEVAADEDEDEQVRAEAQHTVEVVRYLAAAGSPAALRARLQAIIDARTPEWTRLIDDPELAAALEAGELAARQADARLALANAQAS